MDKNRNDSSDRINDGACRRKDLVTFIHFKNELTGVNFDFGTPIQRYVDLATVKGSQ